MATANNLGQKREYLLQRDLPVLLNTVQEASVSCEAGLVATQSSVMSAPTTVLSTGAIIGVAVAGVVMVIAIAAVGVFVARKRRTQKPIKSDKESGLFMTAK